ncbi:2-hydroxyacyl-CoA dehydratase family protein [Carboxydothermus hydrogenoformans]|uniref:2-hydroxyglutaryl-CoA dehydratase, D-component n=1 Tax=Carboxydothermus hydrogenoformans (strain ATCC BAA-161 / DSM 6008 / Z-2901) TaxID=246194 RepID=Q3AFA4_CARHZ|nr:2-hydroxyacyl-CoA dehydratase [Carboxydothermus hydrogenoformans]ABB15137.1 conserved hypothetical protein [Carboxydothermus hydrogenoformans Z-2901]
MKVGITTTIPVEAVFAAGKTPVDLNNIFITAPSPQALVEEAEEEGYPRNLCAWIKGLYTVAKNDPEIGTIIAVTQGDCSNTHALMETLMLAGKEIIPFAYPFDRDYDLLAHQLEKLITALGTTWEETVQVKKQLDEIRKFLVELDYLTFAEGKVTGFENHLWLVSSSDFNQDPVKFQKELLEFLEKARRRPGEKEKLRIAYIGVPPIIPDLYDYLEERGARVVFNEVQRQFSMPYLAEDLVRQYQLYTYPYGIFARLKDIKEQLELREVDAVIHYAQSFCYRQIEDLIIRREIKLPVLTLEGDKPGRMDARTRMRVDAFLDMLR